MNSCFFDKPGAAHGSCDSLAYNTLVGSEVLQSYMSMLMETQWLVVMGTKGTCKTSLATGLARHLAMVVTGDSDWEGRVHTFNVERDGAEVSVCVDSLLSRHWFEGG